FTFNTGKGSFLKNTELKSTIELRFDQARKTLSIQDQELRIDDWPILVSAVFSLGEQPTPFTLKIHSDKAPFTTVTSWLSRSIHDKLDSIQSSRPLDLDVDISGHMKFRDTPTVYLRWRTSDNEIQTPFADFTDCSFTGYF